MLNVIKSSNQPHLHLRMKWFKMANDQSVMDSFLTLISSTSMHFSRMRTSRFGGRHCPRGVGESPSGRSLSRGSLSEGGVGGSLSGAGSLSRGSLPRRSLSGKIYFVIHSTTFHWYNWLDPFFLLSWIVQKKTPIHRDPLHRDSPFHRDTLPRGRKHYLAPNFVCGR